MTTPALVVLADELWQEAYPGPLHVLTAEIALEHPVIWVEAPLAKALKAPGLPGRLRRSLRLDLPGTRYIDARRELDVLTPPLWPPGNPAGDALLAQTVRWVLKARKLEPRVLLLARRGPAGKALLRGLDAAVRVDFHADPQPQDAWQAEVDLVIWPEDAPLPEGEKEQDPRLLPLAGRGVRSALKLVPTVRSWLAEPLRFSGDRQSARQPGA